jgi:hypothetical protein
VFIGQTDTQLCILEERMEASDRCVEELQAYHCQCLDDQSEYKSMPSTDSVERVLREGCTSLEAVGGDSSGASTSSDDTLPVGGTPAFPCPGIGWTWESGLGGFNAEHLRTLAEEEAETESLLADP